MKYQIKETKEATKETWKGLNLFVESAALLVVASFAFWGVYNVTLRKEYRLIIAVSAAFIGIRGAVEFMRHIRRLGQ